jgi:cation:H+ antiporter
MFLLIISLIAGIIVIGYCSEVLVSSASHIGQRLRLSEFVTGFILLGITTSSPEIFIGISSAISGNPQLSLGNLFGADIVLITLICGGAALGAGGIIIRKDLNSMGRMAQTIFLLLAPLLLVLDNHLSRLDGVILLSLYIGYLFLAKYRLVNPPSLSQEIAHHHLLKTIFHGLIGLGGVVISSKIIVNSSLALASYLHIPLASFGTLILSLGTNLPEISVAIAAIRHHHPSLILGDALGSAVTNTLIIALLGLISPFQILQPVYLITTFAFLTLSLVTFFIMTRIKHHLTRYEGLLLLFIYATFVTVETVTLFR